MKFSPVAPASAALLSIAIVAPVGSSATTAQQLQLRPPIFPNIPPRPSLGEETHQVYPDRIVRLNGPGSGDDETFFPSGGDLQFILCTCLDTYCTPGSNPVIGIYGDVAANLGTNMQGMQFGGGDAGLKAYVAHWGDTPMAFTVIGKTHDARIGTISFQKGLNNGTPTGGIADVRFEDLHLEAKGAACVSTSMHTVMSGVARIYDCLFHEDRNAGPTSYGGYGYKWGIRGHGPLRWDVRNCTFDPVQEHCVYIDSPQGDSYLSGITHVESTRTAIQVVNRAFDCPNDDPGTPGVNELLECLQDYENGTNPPRPSGFGKLLIYGVTIGNLHDDGGSAITVVGHKDEVWIDDVEHVYTANAQHGTVVGYCDEGQNHGAHLWTHAGSGQVYAIKRLVIGDVHVNVGQQDRDVVKLAGIGKVEVVSPWNITSNRTAFELDNSLDKGVFSNQLVVLDGVVQRFTGTVENRDPLFWWTPVTSDLSAYPGFHGPGSKIREDDVTLSNGQIDARWPNPGMN